MPRDMIKPGNQFWKKILKYIVADFVGLRRQLPKIRELTTYNKDHADNGDADKNERNGYEHILEWDSLSPARAPLGTRVGD